MKLSLALCASAAVVFLAGCASYDYPAPAVAVATPAPAVVASIPSNTVCYDSFYGPVASGYWGADGIFHYQLVANGPWMIDTARHFRQTCISGFQSVSILPPTVIPPA